MIRRLVLLGVSLAVLACASAGASRAGPAQSPHVIVSLSFDDGRVSQYSVRSVLASHGMQATFFVNTDGIDGPNSMTWQQLHDLASDGNEIGGHTLDHVDLTTVSLDEATRQVCDDRAALIAHGFSPVSFAYPYGAFNPDVEQIVQDCGYSSARSVGGLWNACSGCAYAETIPPLDPFDTRSAGSPVASTPLSELESYVTEAEDHGGGWVQMEFHSICDGCDEYSTPIATLSAFLDWLQPRAATGTVVETVQQALEGGSEPPPVDATPPVTSIACNGGPCTSDAYAAAVSVSLSATDDDSGVAATRYTIDGSDPTTTSPPYTAPFTVTQTTTVKYRSWDQNGNIENTHAQTITITPPPPPPAPSGGGGAGGGGGGGGTAPDLAVTLSASMPTVTTGDTVVYRVEVRLKNPTQTSGVTWAIVTDTLPAGVELVSTKVNRGSGCTGTSTLTCNLDFLSGYLVGVVEITVRVATAGPQVNLATVTALEPDPDYSNNTASVTVVGVQPLPPTLAGPAVPAPKLTQQRPASAAVVRASRTGRFATVVTRVSVNRRTTVTLTARNLTTGGQLTLQPGTRLAATTLRRAAPIVRAATTGAQTFTVEAMLPARQIVRGTAYELVVTATDATGGTSRLTIRFRS